MGKIGIPKALLYHRYYPAWENFFTELGFEVLTSTDSNKKIMDQGSKLASDEVCVPVKLFLGHTDYLKDKVDYLFVPRLVSINDDEYICPKFMGLPDVVEYTNQNLPDLISPIINIRDKRFSLLKSAYKIGQRFDKGIIKTCKAFFKAHKELKKHRQNKVKDFWQKDKEKIVLIGHEYILYDKYMSMDLIDKLEEMGAEVITPRQMGEYNIEFQSKNKFKNIFWTFGRKMMEAADYFMNHQEIDGIIQLTAFGCGPDSLIGEMIERKGKTKKPFMTLNLDEHTGEAGLVTRVEAFLDMVRRD